MWWLSSLKIDACNVSVSSSREKFYQFFRRSSTINILYSIEVTIICYIELHLFFCWSFFLLDNPWSLFVDVCFFFFFSNLLFLFINRGFFDKSFYLVILSHLIILVFFVPLFCLSFTTQIGWLSFDFSICHFLFFFISNCIPSIFLNRTQYIKVSILFLYFRHTQFNIR